MSTNGFPELDNAEEDEAIEEVAPPPTAPTDSQTVPAVVTQPKPNGGPPAGSATVSPTPEAAAPAGPAASPSPEPPPPPSAPPAENAKQPPINPKAGATLLGGAIVTVALALASQYGGFNPEPAVVASLTTIVAFLLAFLVPSETWHKWWKFK